VVHDRYVDLGLLGRGGRGEVRRVYDPVLERTVAMKIQLDGPAPEEDFARFQTEARICARLAHPAILAVYDWGRLQDGRPFIVMPIVSGQDFAAVIQDAYADGVPDISVLKRLVTVVRITCDAIAYAHTQHVLHRDLKPSNIMVGEFGEVLVLDWGLAQLRGSLVETLAALPSAPVALSPGTSVTRTGEIKGSLGYMAPEQASGQWLDVDERTDVFALGAVLFEVLCARPLWGTEPVAALAAARSGERIQVQRRLGLPDTLVAICERAIHPEPARRYQSAAALARAVGDWLDGLDDLLRARALVSRSDQCLLAARRKRQDAFSLQARAESQLARLLSNAPEEEKLSGWRREDEARRLRHESDLLQFQRIQLLQSALTHAPDLAEAHERLASHYHDQHRTAPDALTAERLEILLRQHDRGQYVDYLKGTGRLSLSTSKPAQIQLYVYRLHRRRLRPERLGAPLPAPLVEHELPIGSYLAEITTDGMTVRYPLSITRCGHTTTALQGEAAEPIWIPDAVPADMVYVPAGPYWCGGDERAFGLPLPGQRIWVDGFFISRFSITNAQYIEFLDDLVARGYAEAALACCPRERSGGGGKSGRAVYGRDQRGRFVLVPDHDGDVWDPQWPVLMVPFAAMQAFAAWKSEQTGMLHRLPYELEWEKAARGSGDQREHVWGTDAFDPNWCQVALSSGRDRTKPAPVGTHPVDVSPYGVHGMAGNATDICLDHYHREGPIVLDGRWRPHETATGLRTVRGGQWAGHPAKARLCWRGGAEEGSRSALNGFRLVIPLPVQPPTAG